MTAAGAADGNVTVVEEAVAAAVAEGAVALVRTNAVLEGVINDADFELAKM